VPANRIGFTQVTLAQLKIMQEAITLVVFVPFRDFLHGAADSSSITCGPRYASSARCNFIFRG